jgi:hypothetical protein
MNDLTRSADLAAFSWFTRWLLSGLALAVGILGISAVWLALAVLSGLPCSWLALFAAADMALMLRLTQAPPGVSRRLVAAVATTIAIALSQWLVVATYLGQSLGLTPLESAYRLGPVLAWAMTVLNLHTADWGMILLSLPLAAWWAGGGRRF